jgi:hypothetical protein
MDRWTVTVADLNDVGSTVLFHRCFALLMIINPGSETVVDDEAALLLVLFTP